MKPASLVEVLRARAAETPERQGFVFLDGDLRESERLSFAELDARARTVAAALQERACRGERALLLYPPGLEFVVAFFGCLYAGVVAVPVYPPRPNRSQERLRAVAVDCDAGLVLSSASVSDHAALLGEQVPALGSARWIATDLLSPDLADAWSPPAIGSTDFAFLQYTSGSTATPKGVMVTQGNLVHNEEMIRRSFAQTEESIVVGWLPLYHDMGLIGNVLQPLYAGAKAILMSPMTFLQKPANWLEAISRYRGTTSGGPNFAYDRCVSKVNQEQRSALDLSSWTVAFNGAEPVRAETIRRFRDAFAECGFRPQAFLPCYGLAEATLFVTGGGPEDPPVIQAFSGEALERNRAIEVTDGSPSGRGLVGCGRGAEDQRVVIVAPESGEPCPPGDVGEIWICGPSVAAGYWNQSEESARVFQARLGSEDGPFLRTGDLGFLRGTELFVAGRLKELIILRGRNHYPHDIEQTAERSHPALRLGCGAAFSIDGSDGEERLIVLQEVERRPSEPAEFEAVIEAVQRAVSEEHDVRVAEVVLLRAGTILKTSSGKIQRRACRAAYLAGELEIVARSGSSSVEEESLEAEPRGGVQGFLIRCTAEILRTLPERVSPRVPLAALGLDSLAAAELQSQVEERFGTHLSLAWLLDGPTLAEVSQRIPLPAEGELPASPPRPPNPELGEEGRLSPNQRALWLADRLSPRSAAYNLAGVTRILGRLDRAALASAFQILVDRHAALRTAFLVQDEEPVQETLSPASADVRVEEVSAGEIPRLEERCREEAFQPFDLASGSLMRVRIWSLGEEEHRLLLVLHHLVSDFASIAILLRELSQLYRQEAGGPAAGLSAPGRPYSQHRKWQERELAGPRGEELWKYWRSRLAGPLPALDLATDRPRPPLQTYAGATRAVRLDAALASRLGALSQRHRATLYMTLLAGFHALLERYGQGELVVGAPTAGRGAAGFEQTVGYFVNLLALRLDAAGDRSFAALLGRTREVAVEAFEHQDFPFGLLAERLRLGRDPSRSLLFQTLFVLHRTRRPEEMGLAAFVLGLEGEGFELGNLNLEPLDLGESRAPYDLTLSAAETGQGIAASLQYNRDLFDGATIERMLGHFANLLRSGLANPERRVAELALLSEAESRQLLVEWSSTDELLGDRISAHLDFERQAARRPDAVAVAALGELLSYRELDRRANCLARRLRAEGVNREVLVGIALERTSWLVVALLAVLKSGGAYVPLDPRHPRERLAMILKDARPAVVITEENLLRALPDTGAALLSLGREEAAIERESDEPLAAPAEGENLAYVIFTSGSTGRPKGVQIPHRALVNFLRSMSRRPGLGEEDVLVAVTTVSFDIAALELLLPLSVGARVELATHEEAMDPFRLQDRLTASGATALQSTPATWTMLLEAGWGGNRRLTAFCGGEALPAGLSGELLPRVSSLWNLYGPTETTVWSTAREVGEGEMPVLIGGPIDGTRLRLLDPSLQAVPVGAPGELHIGGVGLARGYLGRPGLTAERFVPDPFASVEEPGARMYRVGDLARWWPDGRIEFLGRIDYQVKIRGFRIELEEVERALAACTGVRQSVVAVGGEASGVRQLVAYVVPEPGERPTLAGLRSALGIRLPDYMLPTALVLLEALPRNPSGKVDRRALPAPVPERGAEVGSSPRTSTEELLVGIWAEVLGIDRVGRTESFFDLGGHSLLATRVVSRVRQVFGVELSVISLFETPTLAGLAARIEESFQTSRRSAPQIVSVPREGELPLSFAQQRLWFIDQLEPGSSAYNMPFAVRLTGELELSVFAAALSELVRRHESLRTVFPSIGGHPSQVVLPAASVLLDVVDLGALPRDQARGEAERRTELESTRPFDLGRGPLLRLLLLRLSPHEHLVLATLHHIIADGWSLGVLFREMAALYEAARERRPSPLTELPIQYADFAVWQRDWLQGEVLAEHLEAWRRLLDGLPAQLALPTDRPRPALPTYRGGCRPVSLGEDLSHDLLTLSRRCGVTLFMALIAGFQSLLGRHSGQDDLAIGSPIANRNRWETEGLIGFFVNTLVLRGDLSGRPSFRELLERTREVTLEAYAYQDLPFEKVVSELAPERNLAVSPLFQVLFVLQNAPLARLALPGLVLEPVPIQSRVAQFVLSLDLEESLNGTVEYSRDLLDGTTVERWMGHFANGLRAAVAEPDRAFSDLPLLGRAERHQVLGEWNENGRRPPQSPSIVPLFERWVDRTPEAPAVFHVDRRLTYVELDRWANRLAHRLLRLGVGAEVRVAVLAERSPELIVALLGVLKAGGTYVPLDVSYPEERLAFMLEDSNAPVLLTQSRLAERLPARPRHVLFLDLEDLEEESAGRPTPVFSPHQLAYMIYTSGSTGRPKGGLISHQALASYTETVLPIYGVAPGDRVLQFCSISFDTSLEEISPCLTGGGELVLRTDAMMESMAVFLDTCRRWSVTVMALPTAFWHEIVAKLDTEGLRLPPSLRLIVLGGERALPERLAAWRRHAGEGARLINTYGLTESTITSTISDLTAPSPWELPGEVSLGRVIPDTEIHLLDAVGGPVPIGLSGELCVGGGLLARGYQNRPEVTAERFVPHPFSRVAGARLYRTGDLARVLPNGELVFLGRGDRQVKVRGYRIELEEIEARLLGHPEVESALVMVREDHPGDKRIVAYLVLRRQPGPRPAELRAFLRAALPDYMVPGAFVFLDAVPLTPNGKVDRSRLPNPELPAGKSRDLQTPVEELVAEAWAQVLGREQVGPNDNFFALGGHSLLVTQVAFRLQRAFGIELSLRWLFEAPTVAELAARVEEVWRRSPTGASPALVRVPRDRDLPLSFAQQRLWLIDQLEPGSPAYNLPAALRLRGTLAVPLLQATLSEIVRRHEVLRTAFHVVRDEPWQVVGPPRPVPLPVVDLSGLPNAEPMAELRIGMEASRPFDLAVGPLIRGQLLRLGPEDHIAVLNLHHIVSDGWSANLLVQELAALYDAFLSGAPSPLDELPVQYADFALWQRGWLQGETLETELAYWREQLRDAPPVLELPIDHPRPPVQETRGEERFLHLPVTLSAEVAALARRESATPFMVLLAAFQVLLSRYSGMSDISVGTPVAGRNRVETEKLIGFFVNTLVLRGDLSGDPVFLAHLAGLREVTLEAYRHQDLPFEKLVEELRPERSLSHTPLFQVMFALQNRPGEELALPGIQLTPLDLETGIAKFDLLFELILGPAGLTGTLEFRLDLFDPTTAERLVRHFGELLGGVLKAPGERLSEQALLSAAERLQILEWNATAVASATEETLHGLFEAQARRTPERVAVEFTNQVLSYAELDERANRLAGRLCDLGVGLEALVGVCAERSLEMMVGLLAVLKAGGAYVPLDPNNPRERLAFMLEEAQVQVLLVQRHLASRMPVHGAVTVPLDTGAQDGAELPVRQSGAPRNASDGEGLAYVIYTSGSTGKPKGAMNTHRAVVNRLTWGQSAFGLGPEDAVLQKTPFGFDVSVWELFWPLAVGARLVMAVPGGHQDPEYLASAIERQRITTLHFVPSMLSPFLETPELERCRGVRRVITSGEALPADLATRFFARLPWAELDNLYGPTEAAIEVTAWTCLRASGGRAVPIGRPISNLRIYLLDVALNPVPVGVTGELCIGGIGVARGYVRRPALTAERFLPDPCAAEAGARMYRTGDLARFLPDGAIEYLGRVDHQVKIRGFRIELGEIEAVLGAHPDLQEVAVLARVDAPGDPRLVAYAVARSGSAPSAAELAQHLAVSLPAYMVPSSFVLLPELPLNANGKVDRRALPAPSLLDLPGRGSYTAPRTLTEERLCEIWAEVLGLSRVGVHDNFFALGGHSLLVPRTVSRLRQAFSVNVPLRMLFERPTVSGMAEALAGAPGSSTGLQVPLVRFSRRGSHQPLSFAQLRFWARRFEVGASNISLGIRFSGPLKRVALERSLQEIVRRHEVLRSSFLEIDGEPVQVVRDYQLAMPVVDLGRLLTIRGENEVARLSAAAGDYPFDIAREPLLMATLLRLAGDEHVLFVIQHHLVTDGWSEGVLSQELAVLYQAYSRGDASPLPDLPLQYTDFAAWQRKSLEGPAFDSLLGYWQRRLHDFKVLAIPTDHPRPAVRSPRGGQRELRLDETLSCALRKLGQSRNSTLFMTLLAAWQALLSLWTGETDIALTTNIANRNRPEVEPLIGLFTNVLVLRTDLSDDPTFNELLVRVRETTLADFVQQDLPFVEILSRVRPGQASSYNELFPVGFVLQNFPLAPLSLPGLSAQSFDLDSGTVPRDLILIVSEVGDELGASLLYRRDIFEEETIMDLLTRFEELLNVLVHAPEERLSSFVSWILPSSIKMAV